MRIDFFKRRSRVAGHGGLAAIMVATITTVTWPAAAVQVAEAAESPAVERTVTLVTGDRVTLDGRARVRSVVGGPGREQIRFWRQRVGADDFVFPADSIKLLADGKLDRRLFNVTKLAAQSQLAEGNVKIIVRYADKATLAKAASRGVEERMVSPISEMTAVSAVPQQAPGLWNRLVSDISGGRVRKVWLDGVSRLMLDRSTKQIGAPAAWAAGLTGLGVKVAVLDGGYDGTHPDLKDAVVETKSFFDGERADQDLDSHGTHVASIVAGSGAASGEKYRGVAPDAQLLIGKVCTDDVAAEEACPDSAVIAGMAWAAERGARIVSLSLGEYGTTEYTAMEEAVDTLTAKTGTLFVAAAGNSGQDAVGSPASADAALAVGSVDRSNRLSTSSAPGPRLRDQAVKPDLVAPGDNITAARSSSREPGDPYSMMAGTSVAAPHVAGAAALIAQAHPDWKASEIKGALMASAIRVSTPYKSGSGRLDLAKAIEQDLFAEPAMASFGKLKWPQSEKDMRTTTVTLHNTSATPLSLSLKLADETPIGLFRVPSEIDVPAKGVAELTVTAESPASAGTGEFSATLVAQSADGAVRARIPVGIVRERESYEHTISLLDRTGKPSTGLVALTPVADPDGYPIRIEVAGAAAKVRLPRGQWTVLASFRADANDENSPTVLAALPDIDSKEHRRIELDGRKAKAVTVTVPDRDARVIAAAAAIRVPGLSFWADGPSGTDITEGGGGYVVPTPATGGTAAREFEFTAEAVFAKPTGDGFGAPTAVYRTARVVEGAVPANPVYHPTAGEFATVTSRFGHPGQDDPVQESWTTYTANAQDLEGGGTPLETPASRTRVTHFASSGRVQWAGLLANWATGAIQNDQPRTFRAGSAYQETWNQPMLTQALPTWAWENLKPVGREADYIYIIPAGWWSGAAHGHWGQLPLKEGKAELYENGIKIDERQELNLLYFAVSTEPAAYRLVVHSTPAHPDVPGARSTLEWTFRSSPSPTRERHVLPVSIAHLAPKLDVNGTAPAGRFTLPIQIQGAAGDISKLTVAVSYDKGQSWTPARTRHHGKTWSAQFMHPTKPGTAVSLRTHLSRADGGTTSYTQISAYKLR